MSQTVDNRVVEMRFENEQFEKGVSQSMGSLDELKKSLDFSDSSKSLKDINKSIASVDTSPLSKELDKASESFSLFDVAAITAIANISNRITNLGVQLAKSLTVGQITSGFDKYEQELRSVQTIMNATGKSIEVVQDQLNKLGWYTDETSYEYSSMVDNISKFTSQGIKLEDAVSSMQGIANMAGLAGASIEDASHAMDGFAKAMAAGNMKLQNWKWIQTAHMETVQTKEAFMEAAAAAGTLKKVSDGVFKTAKGNTVTVASFTETLREGWLNAEAMKKTFLEFSSYSDLVYAFQESYEGLTGATLTTSETIDRLSSKYADDAEVQQAYMDAVNETTDRTIDLKTAQEELANWTESLAEKAFKASQEYRTFRDAIDATKDAASTGWKKIFGYIFGNAEESKQLWGLVGDTLYDVFVEPLNSISEMLKDWKEHSGFLSILQMMENLFNAVGSALAPFKNALSNLFPMLTGREFYRLTTALGDFFESITLSDEAVEGLTNVLTVLLKPLQVVARVLGFLFKVTAAVVIVIKTLAEMFFELFSSGERLKEFFKSLIGEDVFNELASAFKTASESIKNAFKIIKEALSGGDEPITFTEILAKALTILVKIVSVAATTIAKGFTYLLNQFNKIDLASVAQKLGAGLNFVKGVLETGAKFIFEGTKKLGSVIGFLIKNLDVTKLIGILTAIGLIVSIFKMVKFFTDIGNTIRDISGAFSDLAEGFKLGNTSKLIFSIAVALIALAGSLAILAHCDTKQLILASVVMAALGFAIYELYKNLGKIDGKTLAKVAGAMLAFSVSVAIFVAGLTALIPILSVLSFVKWETLGKLGVVLLTFVGIMAVIGNFAGTFLKGAGSFAAMSIALMIFAAGVTTLVPSLLLLQLVKWETLGKIGAILATLIAAIALLGSFAPVMALGAGVLLLLSLALTGLGQALLSIATAAAIFTGLITVMAQLGPAAYEATDALVYLMSMMVAFIPVIGEKLGEAITAFARGIVEGGGAIIQAIMTIFTGIMQAVSANIEVIVNLVISIITAVCDGIVANLPKIIETLGMLVDALINFLALKLPVLISVLIANIAILIDNLINAVAIEVPRIIEALLTMLGQIMDSLVAFIPRVVEFGFQLIAAFIYGLANGALLLVTAAAEAIITFLNGLAEAIRYYGPQLREAGRNVISALKDGLIGDRSVGDLIKAGAVSVWHFITGTKSDPDAVTQAGEDIAASFVDGTTANLGDMDDVGKWYAEGLYSGVTDNTDLAADAGKELGGELNDALRDEVRTRSPSEETKEIGFWYDVGLASGVNDNADLANTAGANLGAQTSNGLIGTLGTGLVNAENMVNQFIANIDSKAGGALSNIFGGGSKSNLYDAWNVVDYDPRVGVIKLGQGEEETEEDDDPKVPPGGSGGSGKGGGSSKAKEEKKDKTIKELINTYKFGQETVDAFNKKYEQSIKLFEEQTGVTGIAQKSVDELALRLYKASDQYQQDLQKSDLKTEEVMEHIKNTFETQLGNLKQSIASVDIWSEFKEAEDPVSADDLITNMTDWNDAIEEWQAELESLLADGNITDSMKQWLVNLGFEGRDKVHALAEATEDEVEEFASQFERFTELQNSVPNNVMATWSASMSGIQNIVQDGAQGIIETLNTNIAEGLDLTTAVGKAMAGAQDIFSIYKEELAGGAGDVPDYAEPIGINICAGIQQGIEEGRSDVINAVIEMVQDAIDAGEETAEIESPSKVFAWMGRMMDAGLVKGIYQYQNQVAHAGSDLVGTAINSVQDSIGFLSTIINDEFSDPVIRPILDLSDISMKAGQLNHLLEDSRITADAEIQNGGEMGEENGPKYQFIQNNYSPKALSRIDIYRQTKNQFSMMKEVTSRR